MYTIAGKTFSTLQELTNTLNSIKRGAVFEGTLCPDDTDFVIAAFSTFGVLAEIKSVEICFNEWGRTVLVGVCVDGTRRHLSVSKTFKKANYGDVPEHTRTLKNRLTFKLLSLHRRVATPCACGCMVAQDPGKFREFRSLQKSVAKLCPAANLGLKVQPTCPQVVRLVGWKYQGLNPHEAGLFCQKTVAMVPEPDNAHDVNAIKVVCDGTHVGYVSRETQRIAMQHKNCVWKFGGYNPSATVIYLKPTFEQ